MDDKKEVSPALMLFRHPLRAIFFALGILSYAWLKSC